MHFSMIKKTKIILSAVVVTVVSGGFFFYRSHEVESTVTTVAVNRGDVAQTVSVTGKLVPKQYSDLSFLRTGHIASVSVLEGSRVIAGQEIASLNDDVLRSQHKAAMIALSIAEENEKLARRKWNSLKPEERVAKKLATEQARETVRAVGVTMKDLVLTSPFLGEVSFLTLNIGETAVAGAIVARVSEEGDIVIESQVPESDIAEIVGGMKASVTFDSLSQNDTFEATVTKIYSAATVSQGVVSYMTEFRLLSGDDRLKEGMTANIDIETAKAENALVIPFRATSREGGRSHAEVKRSDDVFEKVEIVTGIEGDDGLIEVLSGLREGDEVVVSRKK
jgi:RND family efflux transporter MFP subunit